MRRLRDKRHEAGLTEAALALRLKQPPSYVHKCEVGERQLNIWELYQWYQALKLSWPEMMQELDELWTKSLTEADPLEEAEPLVKHVDVEHMGEADL